MWYAIINQMKQGDFVEKKYLKVSDWLFKNAVSCNYLLFF